MRRYLSMALLFGLILSSGCQAVNVNDTAVPIGVGVDWESPDEFKVTAQLAKPQQAGEGGEESPEDKPFVTISKTGETILMAARNLSLILPRVPLWTFTGLIILGENLVAQDAALYADSFARSPDIRINTLMVISKDTSPEEILQTETPIEPLSAVGITKILKNQKSQLGIYVPITIGEFLAKLITQGVDPIVPMVTLVKENDKGVIKMEGTAVFAGAQMIGTFNETESRGYRYTLPEIQQGGLVTVPDPYDADKVVIIELIRTQAKSKPIIDDEGNISMNITIRAEGNFYEQHSSRELINLEGFRALEKLAAQEMEKEIALAIERARELDSDIFGWGQLVYNHYPKIWREIKDNWYDYYPSVNSNIEVNFDLRRSYLTDKTFKFR